MMNNILHFAFCILILQGGSAKAETEAPESNSALLIYLPREITVRDSNLRLGQVSIISGDESLSAKAGGILMGQISVPGQEVVLDRSVVLSRLASSGIPAEKVTLTGAEEIRIKQQQKIIEGSQFVELAKAFLQKNPLPGSVCQYEPMWMPADLIIPSPNKQILLQPNLVDGAGPGQARIQITVQNGGREVAVRQVALRLRYNCRRVVTSAEIPAGEVISPENAVMEQVVSNYPEPASWRPPYGLVARRNLPAKTVIDTDMVTQVRSEVLIKRNEVVVIQFVMPGLLVTASGKAMQQGRAGELIKVRNTDSQRIIVCRINADGTAEPVF